MRVWLASLAVAACSAASSPPRPEPVATPVALPTGPLAPAAAATPPAPWPELNLGFEQVTGDRPSGWTSKTSYEWAAVSESRHGGEYSARLRASGRSPWGTMIASVPADRVRGKHLVLRITDGLAALAKALDAGRTTWARTPAGAALDDVRHDLTILEQATELYLGGAANGFNVRDRAMAANIHGSSATSRRGRAWWCGRTTVTSGSARTAAAAS
jgi:hypothetical protein